MSSVARRRGTTEVRFGGLLLCWGSAHGPAGAAARRRARTQNGSGAGRDTGVYPLHWNPIYQSALSSLYARAGRKPSAREEGRRWQGLPDAPSASWKHLLHPLHPLHGGMLVLAWVVRQTHTATRSTTPPSSAMARHVEHALCPPSWPGIDRTGTMRGTFGMHWLVRGLSSLSLSPVQG